MVPAIEQGGDLTANWQCGAEPTAALRRRLRVFFDIRDFPFEVAECGR
jgi:hypothetical protein